MVKSKSTMVSFRIPVEEYRSFLASLGSPGRGKRGFVSDHMRRAVAYYANSAKSDKIKASGEKRKGTRQRHH